MAKRIALDWLKRRAIVAIHAYDEDFFAEISDEQPDIERIIRIRPTCQRELP
jgi:hypothetical protein